MLEHRRMSHCESNPNRWLHLSKLAFIRIFAQEFDHITMSRRGKFPPTTLNSFGWSNN